MVEVVVPQDKSGIRGFVTRHEVLFGVLGAFIVFVGFFVKEGVREQNKDLADAIETAQANYEIREQLNQGFRDLQGEEGSIQKGIAVVEQRLPPPPPNPPRRFAARKRSAGQRDRNIDHEFEMYDSLDAARHLISNDQLTLARVDKLLNTLPSRGTKLAKSEENIQDLFGKVAGIESDMKTRLGPLEESFNNDSVEKQTQSLSLFDDAVERVGDLGFRISVDGQKFAEQVLLEAQEEQKVAETTKKRATTLSYCLFAVGWSLGLLGRILRIPGLNGGNG